MRLLGNIIWGIFIGIPTAILFLLSGIFYCLLLITIPLGLGSFKLIKFVTFPFGKEFKTNFEAHPVMNVIWIIFSGVPIAMYYIILGAFFCITIVGIPFGLQAFKMIKVSLLPFGVTISHIK